MRKTSLPSENEAAALALRALAFLVRDEARRRRFQDLTGMTLDDLRATAGESVVQISILDHLLADETLLMLFVAEEGLAAEAPRLARMRLSGEDV